MPIGGAAQFSFEPAVFRTKLVVASCLPDVGRCEGGGDGDDAEPAEVGSDHAQHNHYQDGSTEQLVERVHSLVEHFFAHFLSSCVLWVLPRGYNKVSWNIIFVNSVKFPPKSSLITLGERQSPMPHEVVEGSFPGWLGSRVKCHQNHPGRSTQQDDACDELRPWVLSARAHGLLACAC